ncbi:MAG: signal peptidase I [Ruminococcus sp.]|nr:signal peptidase I [Ruminococcus sp.]
MQEQTPRTEKSSVLDDICDLAESVLVSVFVVLLLFTFVFKVATVEGDSMKQTLHDGDRLILSDINYTPEYGDVVIINSWDAYLFDANGNPVAGEGLNKRVVKRIIATGGQTLDIDFKTGTVTVDGAVLDEPYINNPTTRDEGAFTYPITIPEGYVFVLGDNRGVSKDSRHPNVGLVAEVDIVGKVLLRVYPFSDFGTIE